ncbi:hypothetical protein QTO34_003229 [Cnephaeus nilssonii]|uniref:Asparaginase n=1 Tax=Cnephaeus nilssonii TaxID=3371016 RepID=A0AA40LKZ6_CNENI|nr:hypothetical protein QTO34_003229 [Eptesicus nilssonii]
MNPVVVVHGGGASHIAKDRKEMVRQGVLRAATAGYSVLKAGGSAVDAVESAVAVLEDDPEFNAGACAAASPPRGPGVTPTFPNEPALRCRTSFRVYGFAHPTEQSSGTSEKCPFGDGAEGCGSVLNVNGDVEMDASIMNGKDLSSGAVSAVRCIANPIKLARLVMEKVRRPQKHPSPQGRRCRALVPGGPARRGVLEVTLPTRTKEREERDVPPLSQDADSVDNGTRPTPHCFLTDRGAAEFAAAMGIRAVPREQLVTERNRKRLEKEKRGKDAQKPEPQK